jgi:hypothetical protein
MPFSAELKQMYVMIRTSLFIQFRKYARGRYCTHTCVNVPGCHASRIIHQCGIKKGININGAQDIHGNRRHFDHFDHFDHLPLTFVAIESSDFSNAVLCEDGGEII